MTRRRLSTDAGQPAKLPDMPNPDGKLTPRERAQVGNAARQLALTDAERAELARRAGLASTGPVVRARQVLTAWGRLTPAERELVADDVLAGVARALVVVAGTADDKQVRTVRAILRAGGVTR